MFRSGNRNRQVLWHLASDPMTTLLERLRDEFPDSSGRRLRTWLVAGRVRVGGEIVRDPRTPVVVGDRVTLGPAPPPALASPLRLIHEDDSILVIEKPPGLLTIGTEHERERTAYRMVWAYLKGARPPRRPVPSSRALTASVGLLVVAKTPEAQARLRGSSPPALRQLEPPQHGQGVRWRPDRRQRRLPARAGVRPRRRLPRGDDVPRLRRLQDRPLLDEPLAPAGLCHLQHDHPRLR